MGKGETEAEYHSKDFDWEDLKHAVEDDPSLRYHLLPLPSGLPSSPSISVNEASQAWEGFHLRHSSGKFFKERRYLLKEFEELVTCGKSSKVLEVGCGNGSTALPILRGNEDIIVYACDSSTEALERAKEAISMANIVSVNQRFHSFQCDFSTSHFPEWLACYACRENAPQKLPDCLFDVGVADRNHMIDSRSSEPGVCCIGGVDFVTLIFTLSAVPLQKMAAVVRECFSVLKPGGLLLFRDYGLYDMTMLRFGPDQRVGFREYMRADGTLSYFFSLDVVRDLFTSAGFIELDLDYCCIKAENRQNGKCMERVWVHGKFQRPI